jgi:hypothetical protein
VSEIDWEREITEMRRNIQLLRGCVCEATDLIGRPCPEGRTLIREIRDALTAFERQLQLIEFRIDPPTRRPRPSTTSELAW